MTSDSAKTLVIITGVTIAAVSFLEASGEIATAAGKGQNFPVKTGKAGYSLFQHLWATALFFIIMSFLADQVPEVVGPVALLILVAYIYKKSPEIAAGYKHAQGSN